MVNKTKKSEHFDHVPRYPGTLKELAKDIADMSYDAKCRLLTYWTQEEERQAENDLNNKKSRLARNVFFWIEQTKSGIRYFQEAWRISEKYTKKISR